MSDMPDSRVEKWQRWLDESIKPHVYTIHLHRHIYQEMATITEAAELPASYYFDFGSQTYATSQAVAILRLADCDPRVISLGRLITEIAEDPRRFTRELYVGLYDPSIRHLGEQAFSAAFAGTTGDHLDPAIPRADIETLRQGADRVNRYVDQYVAHLDKKPKTQVPTFEDLHKAVDVLGELFRKYNDLLTASDYLSLVPEIPYDWKSIFRVPWITSSDR